ncbi:MAG: hypothetical protein J6J36_08925 [Clostridia bacterium]|nr:hypothetical protein [Clostridia bacterium]
MNGKNYILYSDKSICDEKSGRFLDDTKIEEKTIIDKVRQQFFNGESDLIQ